MIFLLVLIAAVLLCAAFIPMPRGFQVGLYFVAGLLLVIFILNLLGAFPGDAVYVRWPRG